MNGLGELLGCEGAGSAAYFGVFSRLLKCKWEHGFTRRVRRPPTDPVNALLSYGYTVLAGQVAANIATVGFDPYIGYLHSSRYGKTALALDLLEEFRPVIVDSVVLSLFNNRQLEPDSFEPELNSYRMKDATRKLFLTKFEERMQEVVTHPVFEYKVTYRRCIELQARLLAKYLQGEIKQYIPFTVR
jgi:CRISP-associated protein Cas1